MKTILKTKSLSGERIEIDNQWDYKIGRTLCVRIIGDTGIAILNKSYPIDDLNTILKTFKIIPDKIEEFKESLHAGSWLDTIPGPRSAGYPIIITVI